MNRGSIGHGNRTFGNYLTGLIQADVPYRILRFGLVSNGVPLSADGVFMRVGTEWSSQGAVKICGLHRIKIAIKLKRERPRLYECECPAAQLEHIGVHRVSSTPPRSLRGWWPSFCL